jgi:hypothetical protein
MLDATVAMKGVMQILLPAMTQMLSAVAPLFSGGVGVMSTCCWSAPFWRSYTDGGSGGKMNQPFIGVVESPSSAAIRGALPFLARQWREHSREARGPEEAERRRRLTWRAKVQIAPWPSDL